MDEQFRFGTISSEVFADELGKYSSVVAEKLHELDLQRYENIPATVAERRATEKLAFLTLGETAILVDWKLSHGTFRPSLKKLVASNSDQKVQDVTKAGFLECTSSGDKKASLSKLTELKGIGPATASLLLSVYDPMTVPFFSDELFRWSCWSDGSKVGWDRPIKYTPKEYLELCSRVDEFRARLPDVSAVDVEKVAYVLGHRFASKSRPTRPPAAGETDPQHRVAPHLGFQTKKRKSSTKKRSPSYEAPPQDGLGSIQSKVTRSSKRLKSK